MSNVLLKHFVRGHLVVALQHLDPSGSKIPKGAIGVVFEEAEFHEPNSGPMVRWVLGGMCNVYKGQVDLVDMQASLTARLFAREMTSLAAVAADEGYNYSITVASLLDRETRYERTLEQAYSYVHMFCAVAGVSLEQVAQHFQDGSQALYVHVPNRGEGDRRDRHILFQKHA